MALAGIEISYLVRRIAELTGGHYVANVYGIEHESLLVKLHHPIHSDVLLMVTTRGVWPTSTKVDTIEPNTLVPRLRKSLARLRLTRVSQPGEERIMILHFEGLDNSMRLICEFFGGGNIILCDESGKIHALLRKVEVRHRTLRVGAQYAMPPASDLGAASATLDDILGVRNTSLSAAKWLGRSVGLPSRYVEGIFAASRVDPKSPGKELDDDAVRRIHETLTSIVGRIISGDHDPETLVSESGALTVNPIRLTDGATHTPGRAFEELIDEAFTAEILDAGRQTRSARTSKRAAELESQLGEQTRAIELVKERAEAIFRTARSIQTLAASGITSIHDEGAISTLAESDALIIKKRGQPMIRVADCVITVKSDQSMHAIASTLFDESKVQAAAQATIAARQKKIQDEIAALSNRALSESSSVGSTHMRKKSWYERYRWFHTTDGLLAVGGRDSSSNTSLIRKRLEDNDIVFHANVNGSPFFVLKGGKDAPLASLKEVAHATVCFSRAWGAAMHGTDAFWVEPSQIKKAAPSGQYLPKGSFAIEGARNLLKPPTMRLGIGAVEVNGVYAVTCGPPITIRALASCYSLIEPGGPTQSDAAKRVKSELTRIDERFGGVDLDEIARALPAGQSRVVESALGEAHS